MWMNLRRLLYFVTVADELSFTAAARKLAMAQPPLSAQIHALETEIGASLFDRKSRAIALTPAGAAILPAARRLLVDYQQLGIDARRVADGRSGRLSIGLVPSASNAGLPEVLHQLRQQVPDIEISLVEDRPTELLRQLELGRLDVVLTYATPSGRALDYRAVMADKLVVALPRGHILARRRKIPLTALEGQPLILPAQHGGDGLYERLTELLSRDKVSPLIVQTDVWMMQTVAGLVSAGMGLAVVLASTSLVRPQTVEYRPLQARTGPLHLNAVWRAGIPTPPVARFLAGWSEISSANGSSTLGARPQG
jgi:DNA-binding transcriptional LysR family regulator